MILSINEIFISLVKIKLKFLLDLTSVLINYVNPHFDMIKISIIDQRDEAKY